MEQETQAQAILDLDKKSPLTVRGQLLLSNFWFALNFQSGAFLPIVVTTQVLLFISNSDKVVLLGALSALGTIAGLLTQPLGSHFSSWPFLPMNCAPSPKTTGKASIPPACAPSSA